MIRKFITQFNENQIFDTHFDSGHVTCINGNFAITENMTGAEEMFSVGQPVYDVAGNLLGYLGIGLFMNLNYACKIRVPVYYWQICMPTPYCKKGVKVRTYWQNEERKQNE